MKFNFKRIAAGALALALTASMCGCGDNGYLMTVEGMSIRNGIYLSFQQTSYNEAYNKIQEQNGSDDSSSDTSDTVIDVFEYDVENKSAAEWIKEETIREVRKFVAVQKVCEELGITLTEDEIKEMNDDLQSTWDEENFYVQYMFGFNTMGEYYESFGVGIESMKEIRKANALSDKLFLHYYDTDGTDPVSKDEINSYITENYAAVKMLTLSYTGTDGMPLVTDEEKQAVKDKAKELADRLNSGDSIVDVKYDYDLEKAQEKAKADAEESYTEDNEDKLSKEDYIKKAVDAATAEKAEKPEDLDQMIAKENSTLDEKLTEYIWNAAADGKATVFDTDTASYIVVREDAAARESWEKDNHETILKAIKNDEYDSLMELTYQNYDVELDEYLVNTKYAPEKMFKKK